MRPVGRAIQRHGPLSLCRSYQDCIITTRGYDFREGQAQEPFDLFRCYAAVYAREQAYCPLGPALIANLERYWNAHHLRS